VPDFDACHIGDGIERARLALEWYAEVSGARSRLADRNYRYGCKDKEHGDPSSFVEFHKTFLLVNGVVITGGVTVHAPTVIV
jgi:hypothetical protein